MASPKLSVREWIGVAVLLVGHAILIIARMVDLIVSWEYVIAGSLFLLVLVGLLFVLDHARRTSNRAMQPKVNVFMWAITILLVIVLSAMSLLFVGWLCVRFYEGWRAISVTPASEDFAEQSVKLDTELAHVALKQPSPNPIVEGDDAADYAVTMEKWKDWLRKGASPKPEADGSVREQFLVSHDKFKSGFDRNYKDIGGVIEIDESLVLEDGACFLVSRHSREGILCPIYRQMPFHILVKNEVNTNRITLLEPRIGETLLLLIRVRMKSKLEGSVPTDPASYDVRFRVL